MAWSPQYSVRTRGQGTLSRCATMQERTIWDTDAHAIQVAKECVFISGAFSMPRLAVMMAANPQLVFAPYVKSIQNPTGDDTAGTNFPNSWYVHRLDGTKFKQTTPSNWVMESGFYTQTRAASTRVGSLSGSSISANYWADYHIQDVAAKVKQVNAQAAQGGTHPFRGMWFDSESTFSVSAGLTGTNPIKDPSTGVAYTSAGFVKMATWMGDAARNLTVAGVVNPERLWVAANGLVSGLEIAQHNDMAMWEGVFVNNGWKTGTNAVNVFESRVQRLLDCQAAGCVAEPEEVGSGAWTTTQQTQARRFCAGYNILANRGLLTFEYGDTQTTTPHVETAKDTALYGDTTIGGTTPPLDLGAPLTGQSPTAASAHAVAVGTGNGQASATGLYARLFDGGTVLVNVTGLDGTAGASINYKASKSYNLVPNPGAGAASYVAGNLVAVPAKSAVFLTTTSGGTGGTTPTITLAPYILGTAREGQTVYMQPGQYAGSPLPTLTRQWQVSPTGTGSWTNLSGATGNTYTIPIGTTGTPTTYATDAFTRTVTPGWGTADTGGAWITEQGVATDAATNGTQGEITMPVAGASSHVEQLVVNQADVDAKVTLQFRQVATGGNMQASFNAREQDTSNYYRINLLNTASTSHVTAVLEKVVAGTTTNIGGTSKDLGAYTGGTNITVRLRIAGSSIQGKVWLTSGSEPSTWDFTASDSSITAAGNVAIRGFRTTSNTNATGPHVRADNVSVTSTVVSGGTGIAGEYLRVAETATNTAGLVTANSSAFGAIATGTTTDPTWTSPPTISGTANEGSTLTANQGTITGLGTATGGTGGSTVFPAAGCLWGEYTDTSNSGTTKPTQSTIQQREATMGRPFDICEFFAGGTLASSQPITSGAVQWALQNKHVALLTYSFGWGNSFPGFSSVTSGAQDAIIDSTSTELIALQSLGTVILRQFQEFNGTWFAFGAAASGYNPGFVNMWKYIVDRYIANGVDIHGKVLMNWCPNTETSTTITSATTDAGYPGDSYVDTIGVDLYNKDSSGSGAGMSFQSGFSTIYGRYAASGKPFLVPECGCVDHKLDQRANWLNAAKAYIKGGTVPLMKGFCYWDAVGTAADKVTGHPFEYRVDHSDPANATSSADSIAAYKAMGSDAYFSGGGTVAPSVAYQWESSATGADGSWSNVSTATAQTYQIPTGASGNYYRVKVTAGTASATVSMWSRELGPVQGGDIAPSNTTPPSISGASTVGSVLTLTPGSWSSSPLAAISEQWQTSSDGGVTWTPLAATGSTYTIQADDVGDVIAVSESAVNRAGASSSQSNTIGPVTLPTTFPDLTLQVSVE